MEHSKRIKVLEQLSQTEGKNAEDAIKREISRIRDTLNRATNFTELKHALESLNVIGFRAYKDVVQIAESFFQRLDELALTHSDTKGYSANQRAIYETKRILAEATLDSLDRVRYFEIERILEILSGVASSSNEKISRKALQIVEHISQFNLDVIYDVGSRSGIGFSVQEKVLGWIEGQSKEWCAANLNITTTILSQLLSPDIEGTSSDYQTIIWRFASIPASKQVEEIRRRSLNVLFASFQHVSSINEKLAIINTASVASSPPRQSDANEDLVAMISRDTEFVLEQYALLVNTECYQVLQRIEHNAFWCYFHSAGDEAVKAAALSVKKRLDANSEFTIYKNLIGFESIHHDWEVEVREVKDFQEIEEKRIENAIEYAKSVTEENWYVWRKRIIEFSATESDDLATFPIFHDFLREFAKHKPKLALELLNNDLASVKNFTISLFVGLWLSTERSKLIELFEGYLRDQEQLIQIAKMFLSVPEVDKHLFQRLRDIGLGSDNIHLLNQLLQVCGAKAAGKMAIDFEYVTRFAFDLIAELSERGNASWLHNIWFRQGARELLRTADDERLEVVLKALELVEDIDYHAEQLLIIIAKQNPELVLELFHARIRRRTEANLVRSYKAIPYDLSCLKDEMSKHAKLIIATVGEWFQTEHSLTKYNAARLVRNIFPDFSVELQAELQALVDRKTDESLTLVLEILAAYNGEDFILSLCKEIVKVIDQENKNLMSRLYIAIESNGVLVGEYGVAEAYEKKAKIVGEWKSDDNEKVRAFADSYASDLKERADRERRRADEEIVLSKHKFGVSDESEN